MKFHCRLLIVVFVLSLMPQSNLVTGDEETAIGDGDYDFPGNRWGWISTICLGDVTDCDPCDIDEGDYRTQTQRGLGRCSKWE